MDAQVTVVVVPRERFSQAIPSLESVVAHTPLPYRLVYVDVGLPAATRARIDAIAADRGFEMIRCDRFLNPNQARNLGIGKVKTPYLVFVDNDVVVTPGWLEPLLRCAEETGATLVEPLVLEGEPGSGMIHVAGGEIRFIEKDGKRYMRDMYRYAQTPLEDVAASLRRMPTGFAEYHCMLVRTEIFSKIGALDEALTIHAELDLSLEVKKAGGTIYFEPGSQVNYVSDGGFQEGDYPYYFLRWSDAWNDRAHRRFYSKWELSMDDPDFADHLAWLKDHRSRILQSDPAALRWFLSAGDIADATSP